MKKYWRRILHYTLFIISIIAKYTQCTNTHHDGTSHFCEQHSQTDVAIKMFDYSSPKGSPSYQKFYKILNKFKYYNVNQIANYGGENKIFDSVAKNLEQLMEGFGLGQTHRIQPNTIIFATIFLNERGLELLNRGEVGVILLQTEQLCCSHSVLQSHIETIRACDDAPLCVILDYSDHNYRWLKKKQDISSSVVLLPTMLQSRLDSYYGRHYLPPPLERSVDFSFFGWMTPRRNEYLKDFQDDFNSNSNNSEWKMVIEQSHDKVHMVNTYLHSKICLTLHAYRSRSPGEYHRLSEIGISGCIPVMEGFGDKIGIRTYEYCGGVVFFNSTEDLNNQLSVILNEAESYDDMLNRVSWWKERVKWGELINLIFGEDNQEEKKLHQQRGQEELQKNEL